MLRSYPLSIRAKQVLSVLREHGPLSTGVIAQCLEPPMMKRRCREVVRSLREKGLVRKFSSYLPENAGNFHALRRTKPELKMVACELGIDPESFEVCFVRGAEIKHGEQCALWAEYLRKEYPKAKVVRDWELKKHPELKDAFVGDRDDRDLLPDIVMSFERSNAEEPLLIAIEVERTRKDARRLVAKVKSLALQTQLDGVIYVCGDFDIGEALRTAFFASEISKSRRIGSYSQDFLLFSSFDALAGKLGPRCVNSCLQMRTLGLWIDTMRCIPVRSRKNEHFELAA